jgi:predicted XRE-type DNA-binding protein
MKRHRKANNIPIELGSRNVYADLGFADAEDMLVKAQLVAKIAELIRQQNLTQERAAQILGLTQPKVSALLRGQFRGISERKLLKCLTSLGRDVQIVVKRAPRQRAEGRLSVLFA